MKDGEEGNSWTFEVRSVQVGTDRNGNPKFGGYVVLIDKPTPAKEDQRTKQKARKEPRSVQLLRAAFTEALDSHGKTIRVRHDGPAVKAVDVIQVKAEYARRYLTTETDPKKRADAQRKAFERSLEKTSFNSCTQDGTEWIWQ